jgi:hypothetical protein
VANDGAAALASAENVFQPPLLKRRDCGSRDHAAVGDDAHPTDVKAPAQSIDDRQQHGRIRGVAGSISVQIGRPSPSMTTARIICFRSGRWSLEWP